MNNSEINTKVLIIIKSHINDENINSNTDIINSNKLDSFALIQIVMELEQSFNVSIETEKLTIENFKNVDSISSLISSLK